MRSGGASRTAVFVCQGRAAAHGRIAPRVFADPIAEQLLRPDERVPVEQLHSGYAPQSGAERFALASVQACAEIMAPRTVLIDEAIAAALARSPGAQVILLGAGLDARPWRLGSLDGVPVLSIDHPSSQEDMRRRAVHLPLPVAELRWMPVDLATADLAAAVREVSTDRTQPLVWVWEGVIPYLEPAAVRRTIQAMRDCSPPGSEVIANYQTPSLVSALGRRLSGLAVRAARVPSPLADEPWRSTWTPARMAAAFAGAGWVVRADHRLLDQARLIGSPAGSRRSLACGRVLVARF